LKLELAKLQTVLSEYRVLLAGGGRTIDLPNPLAKRVN
jgi:hypothetical protein